jgi:hypothetical protein
VNASAQIAGNVTMLVFWDQRLVFLATPKAGSTAIAAALEPLAAVSMQRPDVLKHTNVRGFAAHVAPLLQNAAGGPFAAVALIRHPKTWLGSWYRQGQRDRADHATQGVSFDRFVQDWCADTPPAYADVGHQAAFLAPGPQGQWLDRLFRYEEIDGFVHYLEERLEFEIILPRLNVSPPGDLALSAATEALLTQKAAADFALYEALRPA